MKDLKSKVSKILNQKITFKTKMKETISLYFKALRISLTIVLKKSLLLKKMENYL